MKRRDLRSGFERPGLRCRQADRLAATASRRLFLIAFALILGAGSAVARNAELDVQPQQSTDGVYQLTWQADGPVVVEEAVEPSFASPRVVYRGLDQATTLTGRSDGTYYYRLVHADDVPVAQAEVVRVTVAHHSSARALGFFAVGLGVFMSTVVLVVRGPDDRGPAKATERTGEGAQDG